MPDDASSRALAAHWNNFPYANISRHWHAFWLRFTPAGDVKQAFHAERVFEKLHDEPGCSMRVAYHYPDERGTVDTGPPCGPWRITKALHNAADGLQHPSQTVMTTLLLPGGPSAWCSKISALGTAPCAAELFLHHSEHLRMSAGVVHAADGALQQLSLIRETSLGPWPSSDWSTDTHAIPTDAAGARERLEQDGAPLDASGRGVAISARLEQRPLTNVPFESTRLAKATTDDVLLLCPDRVAIVAPRQRVAGAGFSCATAWWPAGDTSVLYTIEAHWDGGGALAEVRHLCFTLEAATHWRRGTVAVLVAATAAAAALWLSRYAVRR